MKNTVELDIIQFLRIVIRAYTNGYEDGINKVDFMGRWKKEAI